MKNLPQNLHFYPQIQPSWCWAAVSSMLIACKGGSLKQCEIFSLSAGLGGEPCKIKCGDCKIAGESETVFPPKLYSVLFDFLNGLFRSTKETIAKEDIASQFASNNYVAIGVNYDKSLIENQTPKVSNISDSTFSLTKTTLVANTKVGSDSTHFCLAYGFEDINSLCFLKIFDPEYWLTKTGRFHFTHVLFHEKASRYFGFLLDKKEGANIDTNLNFLCEAMNFDADFDYNSLAINCDVRKVIDVYNSNDFECAIKSKNNNAIITVGKKNEEIDKEKDVISIKIVSIDLTKVVFYEIRNNDGKDEFIPMFIIIEK